MRCVRQAQARSLIGIKAPTGVLDPYASNPLWRQRRVIQVHSLNLNIDAFPSAIVKLAIDLARRFDARIIGVSAADVPPPAVTVDGMVFDGETLQLERQQIEKRLQELRLEFEKLVGAAVEMEWRGAVTAPPTFCSSQRGQQT